MVVQVHDATMRTAPAIVADNRDLQRLQAKFGEYLAMTNGTGTGLMRKKMTDVTIRVGKMFGMLRSGKRKSNRVWFEFEKRQINGRGILVKKPNLLSRKKTDKNGRALSDWQRAVGREIASRVSGSGYLRYQMLVSRGFRPTKSVGAYYRRFHGQYNDNVSKRFGDEVQEVYDMRVPGTQKMNMRYGIVSRALRQVTADIELYLRYKHRQIARDTLERKSGPRYGTLGQIRSGRASIATRAADRAAMLGQSTAARKASNKAFRLALQGR